MKLEKQDLQLSKDRGLALFNLGFRPFFLCAGLFAVLSMLIWAAVYLFHIPLPLDAISSYQWHAHEMIYGYSLAVIAGFLLTATQTWTGLRMPHGMSLFILVFLWLMARVMFLGGMVVAACIFDLSFLMLLNLAVAIAVVRARQWRQIAVISKLLVLFVGNGLFYLGIFGVVENGVHLGIYGGLYLIVGLIMMMARRVLPFFIERGVGYSIELPNSRLIDVLSLSFFLIFFVAELAPGYSFIAAYSALLLFILNAVRLLYWHTYGLWKQPLLWSLYLAMWFISLGFLLHFLSYYFSIVSFIAIHAFAYGGIGMVTIGMMARVALGHTGRNIHILPLGIKFAFISLLLGAFVRVIFSVLLPDYYFLWIVIAQVLWVLAFLIFTYQYFPVLLRKRVDGRSD